MELNVILIFTALALLLIQFLDITIAQGCREDYQPCSCTLFGDGTTAISCDEVSALEVQDVFQRTATIDLYRFDWVLPSQSVSSIPANVLGSSRAAIIRLACPFNSKGHILEIDSSAFASSANYNNEWIMSDCDLGRLNFAFLNNFDLLLSLSISSSGNIQSLETLPVLQRLKELSIFDCTGFDKLNAIPGLSGVKLENLRLNSNELSDAAANLIIDSVNVSQLARLSLNGNRLTQVPERVPSIPKLSQLYLSGNSVKTLMKGSLTFAVDQKIGEIYMPSVGLRTIEPDSFQGDFSTAQISLDDNLLTKLEEQIFFPILDQMIQTGLGALYIFSNPIDCSGCDLAWLIRDNRFLLLVIRGGTCSNSTSFDQLNPNGYNNCFI